jgi:hypothetical protein
MSNGEKFPDTLPSAGIDAVEMRALVGFHDVAGDDACISKGTGAVLRDSLVLNEKILVTVLWPLDTTSRCVTTPFFFAVEGDPCVDREPGK